MTATNPLNRTRVRAIKADIDEALLQVARRYGLDSLKCGSASFSSDNLTLKVTGTAAGGKSTEEMKYERMTVRYGLPAYGKIFVYAGQSYRIVGATRGANKVICVNVDTDRRYRISASYVRDWFAGKNVVTSSDFTPAPARRGRGVRRTSSRITPRPFANTPLAQQPSPEEMARRQDLIDQAIPARPMGFVKPPEARQPEPEQPKSGRFNIDL